jgi:hypothetical protein
VALLQEENKMMVLPVGVGMLPTVRQEGVIHNSTIVYILCYK